MSIEMGPGDSGIDPEASHRHEVGRDLGLDSTSVAFARSLLNPKTVSRCRYQILTARDRAASESELILTRALSSGALRFEPFQFKIDEYWSAAKTGSANWLREAQECLRIDLKRQYGLRSCAEGMLDDLATVAWSVIEQAGVGSFVLTVEASPITENDRFLRIFSAGRPLERIEVMQVVGASLRFPHDFSLISNAGFYQMQSEMDRLEQLRDRAIQRGDQEFASGVFKSMLALDDAPAYFKSGNYVDGLGSGAVIAFTPYHPSMRKSDRLCVPFVFGRSPEAQANGSAAVALTLRVSAIYPVSDSSRE